MCLFILTGKESGIRKQIKIIDYHIDIKSAKIDFFLSLLESLNHILTVVYQIFENLSFLLGINSVFLPF